MPEDQGGQPFADGEGPDEEHTAADDAFAGVVLDEEFVRSAEVHEPTAAERMLAAAQSHAETEVPLPQDDGYVYGPPGDADSRGTTGGYGFGYEPGRGALHRDGADEEYDDPYDLDDERYGTAIGRRPYRGHARWQRPVALVLAIVMGVGVVALAFSALYRGSSGQRNEPAPPHSTSGVDVPGGGGAPFADPGTGPAMGTGPGAGSGAGSHDAPSALYDAPSGG